MNDGDNAKPQPGAQPQTPQVRAQVLAARHQATRPRETAREALQQSLDRRW